MANNLSHSLKLLLISIEKMNQERESNLKLGAKGQITNKATRIEPFTTAKLTSSPEEFKRLLVMHGRIPYQLSNNSVITVCRPLLMFEHKPDEFKTTRFLVEKRFWEKKLLDESLTDDWKVLSGIVLELFCQQ